MSTIESELPQLPHGWGWTNEPLCTRASGHGIDVHGSSSEDAAELAREAWRGRLQMVGMSEDEWDVRERDHRALEALRSLSPSDRPFVLVEWSCTDGRVEWSADDFKSSYKNPADAILAEVG